LLDVTPWPEIEATKWQKVIGSSETLCIKRIDFDSDFENVPAVDLEIFGGGKAGLIVAEAIANYVG
jgi:hypothetical protein